MHLSIKKHLSIKNKRGFPWQGLWCVSRRAWNHSCHLWVWPTIKIYGCGLPYSSKVTKLIKHPPHLYDICYNGMRVVCHLCGSVLIAAGFPHAGRWDLGRWITWDTIHLYFTFSRIHETSKYRRLAFCSNLAGFSHFCYRRDRETAFLHCKMGKWSPK